MATGSVREIILCQKQGTLILERLSHNFANFKRAKATVKYIGQLLKNR